MSVNGSTPPPSSPRSLYNFDGEAIGLVLCSLGGGLAFLLFVPMSFAQGSTNIVQTFKTFLIDYFSWGSSLFPLIPIAYGVVFFTGHPTRNLNRWVISGLIILFSMLCIYEIFNQGSGGRFVEICLSWPINTLGRGWASYLLVLPFAVVCLFYGIEVALRKQPFSIGKQLLGGIISFFSTIVSRISRAVDLAQARLNRASAKRNLEKSLKQQESELKELSVFYPNNAQLSSQSEEIRATLRTLKHQDERGFQMIDSDLEGWRATNSRFIRHACQELQNNLQSENSINLSELARFNKTIELGQHEVGRSLPTTPPVSKLLEQVRFSIVSELKQKETDLEGLVYEANYAKEQLDNPSLETLKLETHNHQKRLQRWEQVKDDLQKWQHMVNAYEGWPYLAARYDSLDDEREISAIVGALQLSPETTLQEQKIWEGRLKTAQLQENQRENDAGAVGTGFAAVPSLDIDFDDPQPPSLSQQTLGFGQELPDSSVLSTAAPPASPTPQIERSQPLDLGLQSATDDEVKLGIIEPAPHLAHSVPWQEEHERLPTPPAPTPARTLPRKRAAKALAVPSLALLDPVPSRALNTTQMDVAARQRASLIEETLQNFKLQAKVVDFARGPTVTRYEIEPAPGEKVSTFSSLANDFARALAVAGVRIEAPVAGKSVIGLEVPNANREPVTFHQAVSSSNFKESNSRLPIILGKTIDGEMKVGDLTKMPHMLIAGSTGSGKSVCVNVLIQSLLYRYLPSELRFLMIDPKMVELTPYNGIPHLVRPVVTDPNEAAAVLLGAVAHMERRYKMMSEVGAKNLEQYNAKMQEVNEPTLPYMVILIDELADLMVSSPKEVESAIMRLAQMARATGMHLILATQRPSVDILTSLIKVNVPARAAFAVSSSHDSRTILDSVGAERLTGEGDMLFYQPGLVKPVRLQGPYITEAEIGRIVKELSRQVFEDQFNDLYGSDFEGIIDNGSSRIDKGILDYSDPLLRDAAQVCLTEGQGSVSRLQRTLRIGHSRAGSLIDMLEAMGIVGKSQGSKPREVLIGEADLPEYFGK